jgi:hypothetical protein
LALPEVGSHSCAGTQLQRETTHREERCQYHRLFLPPQLLVVHSVHHRLAEIASATTWLTFSPHLVEQDCALMLMQEANCGNLLDMASVLRTQAMSPAEHETVVMMCAYQASTSSTNRRGIIVDGRRC